MSEHFFSFTIKCPKCGNIQNDYDGFETDDWTEVFVSSGYSEKSAHLKYDPDYTCPVCNARINRDSLYREKLIEVESIDRLISYLEYILPYVIENGGIYDHGWEPDLDTVFRRYCLLYPENTQLTKLQFLYYNAIHNRRYFTKFEPSYGTSIITSESVPYKKFLEKVYLPDTITVIGDNSFSNTKIEDLFMPRNIISVGNNAFENCFALRTVHSSDSLTEIGDYAFARTKIEKFFFPNGIKKIGKYAFKDTPISEVFIPSGCEVIGEGAFSGCEKLKKATVPGKFADIAYLFEPTVDINYLNI